MAAIYNDAGKTAAADGGSVTTNTGGGNTALTISGTAPVKRQTAALTPPSDTASYEWPANTATASFLIGNAGTLVAATGGATGAWFYLTGLPSAAFQLIRFGNSGQNNVSVTTGGKLTLTVNGTVVYTSTASVPLNDWVWVSHSSNSSSTAGQARCGMWTSRGAPIETPFASASNLNTSGITTGQCYLGKLTATGTLAIMRAASFRGNTDANALIPPPPYAHAGLGLAA